MNESISDQRSPGQDGSPTSRRRWPDYMTVWRWHFYAGLFCIPFVLVLSITGTIFLFRPQIEAWEERELDRLIGDQPAMSYADQVLAAQRETNGWLAALEVVSEPATNPGHTSATRVIVEADGQRLRTYVDPFTGEVRRVINESERFIRFIRQIHGELMLGKRGSYLVELAASWTIIMVVTGAVLWMPRRARLAGVVYPRITRKGKVFWKDLHSVVGFWSAGLIVFLIATGLPWSTFWGDYFKSIRKWTGTSVARQSWDGGHAEHDAADTESELVHKGNEEHKGHKGHGEHNGHEARPKVKPSRQPAWRASAVDPDTYQAEEINAAADYAKTLNWLPPVEISPPADGSSVWTIQSTTANRPHRQSMKWDARTGSVVSRETFSDKHWVDQMVGQGIALHEGQRFSDRSFGWINQAVALFATTSLVMLSCSGVVLWWRRRRQGHVSESSSGLHPPGVKTTSDPVVLSRARTLAVIGVAIALATYLPLFGLSLVIVLVADRMLTRLSPRASRWLGRHTPSAAMGA
ncbi:PepSY-associated TM helix domain-containing protein [Neorhodopirellula pilleata]|uniref:PepSY-associated TM helix n=1 Tax=Neorhodopirellula pilleata TaxID=2714738 RepID=A0A5C6A9F4_9BACT|nr:PepSY domain-containing protein [Neorhodopirellula pilleata]TWT95671.1 PepSY-associated TM helix [Neorhodopirellula pilleata]